MIGTPFQSFILVLLPERLIGQPFGSVSGRSLGSQKCGAEAVFNLHEHAHHWQNVCEKITSFCQLISLPDLVNAHMDLYIIC